MAEPITTLTAIKLLELAFTKMLESGASEAGKKFTEAALRKIDDLRQAIVSRLQGGSERVNQALEKLEQGDRSGLDTVAEHLDAIMNEFPEFAQEIQAIASAVNTGKLQDSSSMSMNVFEQATGNQIKNEVITQGGENYIGNNTIFKTYINSPPQ
jgi:hypothetical protein